jgi:site-specific DNA-methyltransferase (adenine-specific)
LAAGWDDMKNPYLTKPLPITGHKLTFETQLGKLYEGDCISLLKTMRDDEVDVVFADPPFNLNKSYRSEMDDDLSSEIYIGWCEDWLDECIRILKPGGSLFLWNLPKWNTYFSDFLNHRLTFKHWIATDIKYSLPIASKLYPSHYSLLYYVKGTKPNVFKPDRLQMDTCRHCYKEIRDYGGYKNKMNPLGINMSDVWLDIPPVRHAKYKKRKEANELSVKLLDRVIEMSSKEGDVIFDPFGGAGTTYSVSELKKRRWIGIELGPTDTIVDRLSDTVDDEKAVLNYRQNYNALFSPKIKAQRIKRGLWTDESFVRPLEGADESV